MSPNSLGQDGIVARLLKALSVLLLPTLLLVVLLSASTQRMLARPTGQRRSVVVGAGRQGDVSRPTGAEDPANIDPLALALHPSEFSPNLAGDRYPTQITSTITRPRCGQPDLTIDKIGEPDPVEPGGTLVYTIAYHNIGDAVARDVVVTDVLPAEVSLITASPTSTVSTDPLVWDVGHLDPQKGGSIVVTTQVTSPLPYGDILTNDAQIDCQQTDAVRKTITTTVTSRPDLSISKSHYPNRVAPGNTFLYVITYSNTGTAIATKTSITDLLPAKVSYVSASVTPSEFIPAANTLVWQVADLRPPSSDSIVLTVTSPLTDGLVLTNMVEMDCQETDEISDTTTTTSTYHLFYMPLVRRNDAPFCNGDFETQDFTCWAHGGELETSIQCGQVAYKGDCAALLGNPHYVCGGGMPIGKAWISQTFVPVCPDPSRPRPMLSFKYKIYSHERLKSDERDSFEVYINGQRAWRNPSNPRWESSPSPCTHDPWNLGWKESSPLDLSQYQVPITVSFWNASRGDSWFNTYTYVDDVQVTCEP